MAEPRIALITGATGFIGRWAVGPLLARGYRVIACGARPRAAADLPAELRGAEYLGLDLFDQAAVDRALADLRPSHLLHFAWNATPGVYWTALDNYDWVAASLHLARQFRAQGGRRLVVAGTCAEYDWDAAGLCHETRSPTVLQAAAPATPYATCKAALERMLASFARQSGTSFAWGRVFLQYGPYEPVQRLVPSVILALLEGQPAACSHGRQIRSFLHTRDLGDAFAALLDCDVQGVVNVGSDQRTSIAELVQRIGAMIGRPDLIQLGARPSPANDPDFLVPDVARLRDEVGWRPAQSLADGLSQTIAWWRGNRPRAD